MRVLVIQTAFLGDVILTLPLLGLARATEGVEWLGVIAAPAGAELLRTQELADEIIEYDKRGRDRGVAALLRLARFVRRLDVDAALIPHRSFRSALLAWAAGIPVRVGFDESGGRCLLSKVVPYRARHHEAERAASLIEGAGGALSTGRVPLRLTPREGDLDTVDGLLAEAGFRDGAPVILVAPGSRWSTKRWPPERFGEAAAVIAERLGAVVVVTGSPEDREAGAAVARAAAGPLLDLTGKLAIGPWIALTARARLLLSNDSAAVHVASAVGTPVVAIFGPTVTGQGFRPYASDARVVEVDLPCRPCGRHGAARCPLQTMACMRGVSVGAVVETAMALLAPGHGRA